MKSAIRGLALATVVLTSLLALGGAASADLADQSATKFLTALQHNDFDAASKVSSDRMRAAMPQIQSAWQQETAAFGQLKSFEITDRASAQGEQVRIVNLTFERPSGLAAQIAVDGLGNVSGIYFVAAKASPEAAAESKKLADDRVNEMLKALQQENFDAAEAHFDSQMKSLFGPAAFEQAWKERTGSLGDLKAWRIARSADNGGIAVRVVNVDFANKSKAFALKIAIDSLGEISGLYFVDAQSEAAASSKPPSYIRAAAFTAREVEVDGGGAALGGTLTIPNGNGPFPGAVLVHGSGPNDRDENLEANHPFLDIAEGLSSSGIAVLRYDKRSRVHPELLKGTVQTEVIDDAVAAVALLKHQPQVNPARVFVVGHSLGALLAPEIAFRAKAAGAIMLAPPGLPLEDIIARQARYPWVSPQGIPQADESARLIKAKALAPNQPVPGMHETAGYFYDLDSRDEVGYARKLGKPILILHGTRDFQIVDEDIDVWRKGLASTPNVRIDELPGLNHLFIAGTGKPGPNEYMVPSYVAPEVIAKVSSFIEQ
ncbi:MAG TPA: alpha/beta fold hydrolase [Candidatus Binataceae bacterium]|nr:alpha/beta fold hydrolase [Candidatus Binataceae bacterium]